ncbi:MAG TPA: NUDIX domain-containing protein [Lacipirellula sp.]
MSHSSGNPSKPAKTTPTSAGILLYRKATEGLEVLLAHPGGPFFAKKDEGAWTIPKGLIDRDESQEAAALREFEEELGWRPQGAMVELGEVRLKSGKRVVAFALETNEEPASLLQRFIPGVFTMGWPRGSSRYAQFPEIDRIEFLPIAAARVKISPAQAPLLDRLVAIHA